jgi:hypothetical protein
MTVTSTMTSDNCLVRVIVSKHEESAIFAKQKWFGDIDNRCMFRGGLVDLENAYEKAFPVSALLGHDPSQMVYIFIFPDPSFLKSEIDRLCKMYPNKKVNILCHFKHVNECFEQLSNIIKKYVVYTHDSKSCEARIFKVINKRQPKPYRVALPKKDAGIYIVQAPDLNEAQKWVTEHLVNGFYCRPKHVKSLLKPPPRLLNTTKFPLTSRPIHLGDALVYVPMGQPDFLGVFLRHDLLHCPEFLLPGCLHVFMNPRPDAIEELRVRVMCTRALQDSMFVCITNYNVQDLLYCESILGSHWNPVGHMVSYKRIFTGPKIDDTAGIPASTNVKDNNAVPDATEAEENKVVTDATNVETTPAVPEATTNVNVDTRAVTQHPIRFIIRERTFMAELETELKFFIRTTVLAKALITLKDGFPVEKEYALWFDGEYICKSTVMLGELVFEIPAELPQRTPRWGTITMLDPTEDCYLSCPKTGRFYFSQYKLEGLGHTWLMNPRMRYKATVTRGVTLSLKLQDPPGRRFWLNWDHEDRTLESRAAQDKLHFIDFGVVDMLANSRAEPEKSNALLSFHEHKPTFFPKKIRVTEMYLEQPSQ